MSSVEQRQLCRVRTSCDPAMTAEVGLRRETWVELTESIEGFGPAAGKALALPDLVDAPRIAGIPGSDDLARRSEPTRQPKLNCIRFGQVFHRFQLASPIADMLRTRRCADGGVLEVKMRHRARTQATLFMHTFTVACSPVVRIKLLQSRGKAPLLQPGDAYRKPLASSAGFYSTLIGRSHDPVSCHRFEGRPLRPAEARRHGGSNDIQ